MTIILLIAFLGLLLWLISRVKLFSFHTLPLSYSIVFFVVKCGFAIALWAVYTFYYTERTNSDIYKFFDDGEKLQQLFSVDKKEFAAVFFFNKNEISDSTLQMKNWERNYNEILPFNENRLMIRVHTVLHFFSAHQILFHQFFFAFLSYLGCVFLFNFSLLALPAISAKLRLLAFAFPSFLFWTSGGLKESLVLFFIGGLLFYFYQLTENFNWRTFFIAALFLWLLLIIKTLVGLLLFFACLIFVVFRNNSIKKTIAKYAIANFLVVGIIWAFSLIGVKQNVARLLYYKQFNAINEAHYLKANSISSVPIITKNIFSVVAKFPIGIMYGLFKPFPSMTKNPMMLLSMLENLILIGLLLALLYFILTKKTKIVINEWFVFLLYIALVHLGIVGLLTPVVGNLVRYKVIVMPLLLLCIFTLLFQLKKENNNEDIH